MGKILTKSARMLSFMDNAPTIAPPNISIEELVSLLQTQKGYFSLCMHFEQQGAKKETAYQLVEMLNRIHGLGCRYSSYVSFRQMKYRFFACGGTLSHVG